MTSPTAAKSGGPPGRGVEDGRDLAEVVGAEDARGDHRERLRVDVAGVVELVDGAPGMQSASPGPTSTGTPSIVQVRTPSSP
jgi:hypothetical protein